MTKPGTPILFFPVFIILTGCAECETSADCASGELCIDGVCRETEQTDYNNTGDSPSNGGFSGSGTSSDPEDTDSDYSPDTGTILISTDPYSTYDTEKFAHCDTEMLIIDDQMDENLAFDIECTTASVYIDNTFLSILDLPNLQYVGGDLSIGNNDYLYSLESLNNLKYVGGDLVISGNNILSTTPGFENLSHVKGDLILSYNELLNDLEGFSSLYSIGGSLLITDSISLTGLEGFDSLMRIYGGLDLYDNPFIDNMDGLSHLEHIGGYFTAIGNDQLPYCELCDFLEQLESGPASISFSDNLDDTCSETIEQCLD